MAYTVQMRIPQNQIHNQKERYNAKILKSEK